jgi:hypothetical protein
MSSSTTPEQPTPRSSSVFCRILRALGRIALWGVVSVVVLILAALAINYSDEPLSPQASALLEPPKNPYKPEDNLYIALAGFGAPAGQSMVSAGEASIARYNAQVDLMIRDPMLAISGPWSDPPALKLSGSLDLPHPREARFWESVRTKRAQIEELVGENRELYERFVFATGLLRDRPPKRHGADLHRAQ